MEKTENLSELTKKISGTLLDSLYLTEISADLVDGEAKENTLVQILKCNIKKSFLGTEKCRKIIGSGEIVKE